MNDTSRLQKSLVDLKETITRIEQSISEIDLLDVLADEAISNGKKVISDLDLFRKGLRS